MRHRSDCGSPSDAGFYASEVGKTWRMVIRKNITLVGCYRILYFWVEKGVVSGAFLCRYIIKKLYASKDANRIK